MDYPTSPSPYDQFIKKQRQVSYNTEYKNKTQIHQQQSSDDTTIEAEVSQTLFNCKQTKSLI